MTIQQLANSNKVFVRTVTHYYTGRIDNSTNVPHGFLMLEDAAWIADTGRWHHALSTGELNEVEPFPDGVLVAIGSIVDVSPWNHELPSKVK
jgi:hypothetical protein